MINKEELKTRTELEKEGIEKAEIKLPEQTVFAAIGGADMLLRNVLANKTMNLAFKQKAYDISQSICASVNELGLKAEIPGIDICGDYNLCAKSISAFIDSCIKAGKDIEKVKKDAKMKLNALAIAVENSNNPDIGKIKAHVNYIINAANDQIFAFDSKQEKKDTAQVGQRSQNEAEQKKKLDSAIDWEAIKSKNPELYGNKSKLTWMTYGDVVDLYTTLKGTQAANRDKKEEASGDQK